MPNFEIKAPYRICERIVNSARDPNKLAERIPLSMHEYFTEIIQDDARLAQAYVDRRYVATGYEKGMNAAFPTRFTNNTFSQYSSNTKEWEILDHPRSLVSKFRPCVTDPAELALAVELARLEGKTRDASLEEHAPRRTFPAFERLLVLQGGIGSGKTTMLHHLGRIVLPQLLDKGLVDLRFHFIIVDLNTIGDSETTVEVMWQNILASARHLLEMSTNLVTTDDWLRIADAEIHFKDGSLKPTIATSRNPEAATRKIVAMSAKDEIYIRRVSRYVRSNAQRGAVVLILDNLDIQSGVKRQLSLLSRLVHLLDSNQDIFGIVPVREYTLGNLDNMSAFRAYLHVNRMHMTTPMLGEMVQKRFDAMLAGLDAQQTVIPRLPVKSGWGMKLLDVRDIFTRIRSAFEEELDTRRGFATANFLRRPAVFLHNITNSNARSALQLVLDAMSSWALRIDEILSSYFWQKDHAERIKLPAFTVDELIRLSAVGKHSYYDHDKCPFLFNIFYFAGHKPRPENGRFPLLILYRMAQYFDTRERTNVNQFFEDFRCFGYSSNELKEALSLLMKASFLESPDGSDLNKIEFLFTTRKNWYYVHKLSKMIVYLENVRNDAVIEYKSNPHEVRDTLANDVQGVLDFVCYVLDQECKEWGYVKRRGQVEVERYKRIATVQPICWKLFRSVVKRCDELFYSKPHVFTDQLAQMKEHIEALRIEILSRDVNELFWPRIPRDLKTIPTRF